MINLILIGVLILMSIIFVFKKENFQNIRNTCKKNLNRNVLPDGSSFKTDNIAFHEMLAKDCPNKDRERTDNYCNHFFDFRNRIWHNSHLDDPVDYINITNKAQDYELGKSIADIYDDLTN